MASFFPIITIKAKDFANEITNFNIKRDEVRAEARIADEYLKSIKDV